MPRHAESSPVERLRSRLRHLHGRPETTADDGGFVLIEVIVGMIIFGIVAAGATLAIIGGIGTNNATSARVGSANVAQQALAQAQAMPRASLAATPVATTTVSVGNAAYTVTRQVSFPSPAPAGTTACPTAALTGGPYAMVVHVVVNGTGRYARSVSMDTVLAC